MDNQHRKIKGYRELNESEIAMMNMVKELGTLIGNVVDHLESEEVVEVLDKRWLEIGKTELQKGLMALTRSIAKPDFF